MHTTLKISPAEFQSRSERLLERLQAEDLSGVVLFDNYYVLYYTGFAFIPTERPMALAVNAQGERALFVPRLELEHAQAEAVVDRVDHYPEYPDHPHPMVLLKGVLENMGIELIEIRLLGKGPRTIVRLYVDETGGISLARCAEASRRISELLDRKDPIEDRYVLEVSSPGTDRPLSTVRDFLRHLNRRVEVILSGEEQRVHIRGRILNVEENRIALETDNGRAVFLLDEIISANILVDL